MPFIGYTVGDGPHANREGGPEYKYSLHQTRNMGLADLSPETEEADSGGSQSTYVTFKNPDHPEVELDEDNAHRHKPEYYKAVQRLRDIMGRNINVAFGEFAAAAVQAHDDGDPSALQELFEEITA